MTQAEKKIDCSKKNNKARGIISLAGILKGPKSAKELITESRKNISKFD